MDLLAAVAMTTASIVFIWGVVNSRNAAPSAPTAARRQAPLPDAPIHFSRGAAKGDDRANVGVVIFSDFECPFCGKFARETLPAITARYVDTGRVRFVFRHLPLERIHPHARLAAQSTECAREQGRFWQLHDALFEEPRRLQRDDLVRKASSIDGLDVSRFTNCLTLDIQGAISADVQDARSLAVTGTPTFFFGRIIDDQLEVVRRESGALPVDVFSRILDELLRRS